MIPLSMVVLADDLAQVPLPNVPDRRSDLNIAIERICGRAISATLDPRLGIEPRAHAAKFAA
jgi:hypothetical protein